MLAVPDPVWIFSGEFQGRPHSSTHFAGKEPVPCGPHTWESGHGMIGGGAQDGEGGEDALGVHVTGNACSCTSFRLAGPVGPSAGGEDEQAAEDPDVAGGLHVPDLADRARGSDDQPEVMQCERRADREQ